MDGWLVLCPVLELVINNTEKNSFDHSKKHLYFLLLRAWKIIFWCIKLDFFLCSCKYQEEHKNFLQMEITTQGLA